jgi:hypothetical protein
METANVTDYAVADRMKVVPIKRGESPIPILIPPDIRATKGLRVVRIQNPGRYGHQRNLFYYPSKRIAPGAVGELCVVQKKGESDFYLRQVMSGSDIGRYNLENPFSSDRFEVDVMLQSAAPIVGERK